MVKDIFDWEIHADARCSKPTYAVYFVGQWDCHVMDWAGMNCRRIKAPGQPKFHTIKEAAEWAEKNYKYKTSVDGEGQHVASSDNYMEAKIVAEKHKNLPPEYNEEEWENLRDEIGAARQERERYSW